jgi:hypothetical protein
MAHWQQSIRDKLFALLLTVLALSIVGLAVTALLPLLSIIAHWGPVLWASMVILVLIPIALFAWQRRVREAHAQAAGDTFSFAEWVIQLRAKEEARASAAHGAPS